METIKSLMNVTSDCTVKRKNEVKTVMTSSGLLAANINRLVDKCIIAFLKHKITLQDIENECMDIYANDTSVKGCAKNNKSTQLYKCIERYLKNESRADSYMEAPETVLDIYGTEVLLKPGAIFVNRNSKEVEVVQYFYKKPEISPTSKSMALYTLLYYAKQVGEMVFPGENIRCTGSFYYLRKSNDRKNAVHPEKDNFDLDFFDRSGKNVISMIDWNLGDNPISANRVTDVDAFYYGLFKEFQIGHKHMYCDDCKYCSLKDVCSYKKIKMPIPTAATGSSSFDYTDEQKSVINHNKGYARVLAIPGSGKTATIGGVVLNKLLNGENPSSIVVTTFTNAAAQEMKERISNLCIKNNLPEEMANMCHIMTMHKLGDELIQANYQRLGYSATPTPISDSESLTIIEELVLENEVIGLDYDNLKLKFFNIMGAPYVAKEVFEVFKNNGITEKNLRAKSRFIMGELSHILDFINEDIIYNLYPVFLLYQEKLKQESLVDYIDQELAYEKIDKMDPEYFRNTGFKHIIVDEAQDCNNNQAKIMKILCKSKDFTTFLAVGDIDQSIYGFRRANPEILLNIFGYLGVTGTDYYLTKNYRSTQEILDLSKAFIRKNKNRVDVPLNAMKHGSKPNVKAFTKTEKTYAYILEEIKKIPNKESIGVIFRTKGEVFKFKRLLDQAGIEANVLVPEVMQENSNVNAVMGLFKFLNTEGDESGIVSYVNACTEGKWFDLTNAVREKTLSDYNAFGETFRAEESSETKLKLFLELINRIPNKEMDEVFAAFMETLEKEKTWGGICSRLTSFEVYGEGDTVSKQMNYDGVTLTTAHSSKGLEWPNVFVDITKFDNIKLRDNTNEIEETRRLLYVAFTRAKERLDIVGLYYSYGTKQIAIKPDEPDSNMHLFMKELYKIVYPTVDIHSELKTAR